MFGSLVVLLAVDAVILSSNVDGRLYGLVAVTPVALYLFLAARRTYAAVGDGWLYVRAEAFGKGHWTMINDIVKSR